MFDDISQASHGLFGVTTTTLSSHNPHASTTGIGAAVVAASTPCAGSHVPSTAAADAQLTRWLWVDKAMRFRSLLPSCFRLVDGAHNCQFPLFPYVQFPF